MNDLLETVEYQGKIAFHVAEQTKERAVGKMKVTQGILNPFGVVHAGAIIWFADVIATRLAIAQGAVAEDGTGFPLAIDLHSALVGNQREGELTATAQIVRTGKRVTVVRTDVTGRDDRLLLQMTTTHIPSR